MTSTLFLRKVWPSGLVFVIILYLYGAHGLLPRSKISLQNNGYTGILVAISEHVEENATLVERLKELFTNASNLLHRATHQRAYFEEITILLPKTWSSNIPSVPATSEMFDTANFIVTRHEHVGRESPYTNQFGSCGDEAEYTHLTDKFILDTEWTVYKYGDPGKVIVHEWGHLRWGLFDEYATNDKERFYLDQSRRVQATRCSEYVTGEEYDYRTGHRCNLYPERGQLPGSDCRFYPALDNSQATGSYMSMSYLESVVDFCHSDIQGDPRSFHNPRAPSQQNIQCSYRSAWDVMLESEDFNNGNNLPRQVADTAPTFYVVKSAPLRIVLLLDVSGSMSWNNRLGIMNQVASKYIRATVPDGNFVGIVEFDTYATTRVGLTEIRTTQDRDNLANNLPTVTRGTTCIGCGFIRAVQVLESGGQSASGGIILLITDGVEDSGLPNIVSEKPTLISKGVLVDTVAFSDAADAKLMALSEDTGGLAFYHAESSDSTGLNDALTATISLRLGASSDVPTELHTTKQMVPFNGSTLIDETIGKDLKFFFLWSTSLVSVEVRRPNGDIIDSNSPEYRRDDPKKTISVEISGHGEPGTWMYDVRGTSQAVEVSIQSTVVDNAQPVRVTTSLSNSYVTETPAAVSIYAQVVQGYTPILDAVVIATIERPSTHPPVDVNLLDNGAGTDVTKNDGIYSGVFMDFVTATCPYCRYNIKVTARGVSGKGHRLASRTHSSVLPIVRLTPVDRTTNYTDLVGQFNRVVSGGVIQAPLTISPGDNLPPSRITDLRVVGISFDNHTISLAWTSPGNDLDRGTADEYDLRYGRSFSAISQNFTAGEQVTNHDIMEGNLTTPKPFGSDEYITVQMPKVDDSVTYYFCIRAMDTAGNKGSPSNVISVAVVQSYPDVPTTEMPTTSTVTIDATSGWVELTDPPASPLLPMSKALIVIGAAAAAVCAFMVTIAVIGHLKTRPKSFTEVKEISINRNHDAEAAAPRWADSRVHPQ